MLRDFLEDFLGRICYFHSTRHKVNLFDNPLCLIGGMDLVCVDYGPLTA